jgi:hypothetical protein
MVKRKVRLKGRPPSIYVVESAVLIEQRRGL